MVWDFGVKEKGKVPAREFRVAREIRRFEFLPRPTRGFLGNDSCVDETRLGSLIDSRAVETNEKSEFPKTPKGKLRRF